MIVGAAVAASTGSLRPDDKSTLDEFGRNEELDEDEVGKDSCGCPDNKPSPPGWTVLEGALEVRPN